MRIPTFHYERELIADGYTAIGVDEAGCGCLAGPVVAAALHLPLDSRIGDLRDSKLLSPTQRERLVIELADRGAVWAVGIATNEEVDAVNIRQATYLAMERAIRAFRGIPNTQYSIPNAVVPIVTDHWKLDIENWKFSEHLFALVDAWTIPNLPILQRAIVHGDRLVKSIAAASIVAKVARDRMMDDLDRKFPVYGFARHKGYATVEHRRAIAVQGLSPIHRRTFCHMNFQ